MTLLQSFKVVLVCMVLFLTPLAAFGEKWPPLMGLTALVYLIYMFFFCWDEQGAPHPWLRK